MPEARNGEAILSYEAVGGGPPLLLLHPGLCDGSLWGTLGYVAALQQRFRLLIPDLRGHGRSYSPHDAGGYAVDAMRDDIGAILDAEGLQSAHAWGFSLGGLLALRFAIAWPRRLRSLVAGASIGYLHDSGIGSRTATLLESRGLAPVAPPLDGDPAVLPLRPVMLGQDLRAHIVRYRAQAAWNRAPTGIEQLTLPLLLYVGEADSFAPPVRALAAALPQARLLTIPKLGHLQLWSHPELILAQAITFIEHAEASWRTNRER